MAEETEDRGGQQSSRSVDIQQVTLPTLDDVCGLKLPLVKRVPARSRVTWAEVLALELGEVASTNNLASRTGLEMLAKTILWLPRRSRGGKSSRGKASLNYIIDARTQRWSEGDLEALWSEAVSAGDESSGRSRNPIDEKSRSTEESPPAHIRRTIRQGLPSLRDIWGA